MAARKLALVSKGNYREIVAEHPFVWFVVSRDLAHFRSCEAFIAHRFKSRIERLIRDVQLLGQRNQDFGVIELDYAELTMPPEIREVLRNKNSAHNPILFVQIRVW